MANKGSFKKGDPRINRKGRPKTFDALRTLAQQIAHEVARNAVTKEPLVISGRKVTIGEAILRGWAMSGNKKYEALFIEVAFGKVPTGVEMSAKDGKPIILIGIDPDGGG